MGDVIVDAATRHASRRILRQVRGHDVTAHALTHVHPDHQGASKAICEALGLPLWVGEADVPAMETGDIRSRQPDHWVNRIVDRAWSGPPRKVDRALHEGTRARGSRCSRAPANQPAKWPNCAR